jgi:hypothetical protein
MNWCLTCPSTGELRAECYELTTCTKELLLKDYAVLEYKSEVLSAQLHS